MNTNNELNMIESHFKVEFSAMSNKDLYAWLRASFPAEKFLTGRTKAQLYHWVYIAAKEQLVAKQDKECDEMQANDSDAPADAEEDAESVASEEEEETECNVCGKEFDNEGNSEQELCDNCEQDHRNRKYAKYDESEEDAESVADEVWMSADMVEEDDKSVASEEKSVTGSDIFGDDEDDTPVATLIANRVAENKDELIAKLQAQVAELQLQLQDAKDDIKDMVVGLKGIITNQQSRETFAALPAYEPAPRCSISNCNACTSIIKKTPTKPALKAPVEQPEGKRYTYKRPITYEHDYCKDQMVVEMSIKRLWVKGTAMRLAFDPYGDSQAGANQGHWVGLNGQWKGHRFLNLQRASTECCELNQIANSPNAWAAFRCINPENDEYISIERLDKHPNWRECRVLMRDDKGASGEDSEDEDE